MSPPDTMPVVEARGLTCRYSGRLAVAGVSFAACAGEVTAILGPNGAGKSTLLKALSGLVVAEGEVRLAGRPLSQLTRREVARLVALVAQDPPADAPFTVGELVLMGRAPHLGRFGVPGPGDRAAAVEAMRAVEVEGLADRPIDELSGGERRRAFLARALAQRPKVLLLDEPTAFLDLGHQARLLERCAALAAGGLCVVCVLHDPSLAAAFAQRVLLMKDGAAIAQGPAGEVLRAPALSELFGARLVELRGAAGEGPLFGPLRACE